MPETLGTRLAEFASSLRTVGAIRSDVVEHAFASVARHRCVPRFCFGPKTITVPQNKQPSSEVLDIVYSHQSLLTSTGQNGDPPSSSSAPTLMARMLEALDLQPGMRVLEIGAGTGYNAALVRHEAPLFSCGDERSPPFGLSQQVDEAGGSLTAETRGRMASGPDKAGTCWYCQTVWVRRARREAVREEPVLEAP